MKRPCGLSLLCAVLSSGCASTWHTVEASPAAAMAAHGHGDVRVTRRNGSIAQLHQPVMSGDSIVGYEDPPWDQGGKAARQAIPLDSVRSISVWERDKSINTVLWVAGATVGALFLLGVATTPYGGMGGT